VLGRLKYRAPELIVNRVRELLGPEARLGDVLDLGCGTGLCGALLRPMAGRLVGIDLSPAMIAKARERGCYDDLVEGEITAYLDARPEAWDAAVAADVLCYLGDLRPLFAAAAHALRPGAPLAFTVEAALDPASPPYVLHPHGRYSQREDFVREALAGAGLEVVSIDRVHLRVELKVPVEGFLVVARRPAGH
jgi:predicted TPR repeat methyltransferase